jgi:GDPmannose 4,6-dehydratase
LYVDPHEIKNQLFLYHGDLSDGSQLIKLLCAVKPDEIYHLGAQTHVKVSFDMPEYTGDITALGTTRLLEAIRSSGIRTKYYQASSSEMFGDTTPPQDETTPFRPRSPYAAAKVYAYWMTVNYRDGYNLFASNGIMFNHESPRRGETFVTRKITRAIANIIAGKQRELYLGNLEAKRDWGYAPEYVQAMWLMLQQEKPDDYVVGTGGIHSVKEFVQEAFCYVGLDWEQYVKIDPHYLRPTETSALMANASKAKTHFGWEPKVTFKELVRIMVDADMKAVGLKPIGEGQIILAKHSLNGIDRALINPTGGMER